MIELFDPERLLPRRDWSQPLSALALLLVAGGIGLYGVSLQARLQAAERQRSELDQRLRRALAQPTPSSALLDDLQREAERLESEAAPDPRAGTAAPGPTPSQWLLRLGDLGNSEISLAKVEVDRGGAVRIEGLATSPQALSRFLLNWDQAQQRQSPLVPARAIEVRQDSSAAGAPLLRFQLRAAAPLAATVPPVPAASPARNRS